MTHEGPRDRGDGETRVTARLGRGETGVRRPRGDGETGVTVQVSDNLEIIDERDKSRLVAKVGDVEAELVYRVIGNRLVIVHTGVPEELAGHGIGGKLVAAALEKAVDEGLVIAPRCPFATKWLHAHPEDAARANIDWSQTR